MNKSKVTLYNNCFTNLSVKNCKVIHTYIYSFIMVFSFDLLYFKFGQDFNQQNCINN